MDVTISLDLERVVNEEYEKTLKKVLQEAISDELDRLARDEIQKHYRKTINAWLRKGVTRVQIEGDTVILPMWTEED